MLKKIEIPKKKLHILICTTNRSELPEPKKPDCGPKISLEELKQLKLWVKEQQLIKDIKITQTKCLGLCLAEGPAFMVYPNQEYYVYESVEDIKNFILENL